MTMSKKRQVDNNDPILGRANKRRGALAPPTTLRMTRSAYKKLNAFNNTTVQLNPGLPMESCRQKNNAAITQAPAHTCSAATVPAYALGITSDARQVCISKEADPLSRCGNGQEVMEFPVAHPDFKSGGRPSDAALASYALGVTPDGRQVCIPLTPDSPSTGLLEAQWNPVVSYIAEAPAQRAPALTQAANAGGPAPVAYMGGPGEDFPVQPGAWEVICAAYTPRSPVGTDHESIQELRTGSICSDRSSQISPLSGPPLTCSPPLHPSALPDFTIDEAEWAEEVPEQSPNPDDVFDPSWCFPKVDSIELTGTEKAKKALEDQDQPVSAIMKATYSLSPQDAIELMVSERILQAHKDYSESLVVEIPCSPAARPSSEDWTMAMETTGDTGSLSEGDLREQSVIAEGGSRTLGGFVEAAKESEEDPEPVTTEDQSAPKFLADLPTLADMEVSACPGLIPEDRGWMTEQEVSGQPSTDLMQAVYPQEHSSIFPPWPYSSPMSSWPADEGQYSIETYEEDSVIY